MNRRDFLAGTTALLGGIALGKKPSLPTAQTGRIASGRVINTKTGRGIPNVRVSNGLSVVKTDSEGRYQISLNDDTVIHVVKPRGFKTPVTANQIPQFFYIHKPNGSPASRYEGVKPTGAIPESIDFHLTPQAEPDRFKVVMFGDPQPRNQTEIDYMSHDVIEQVIRDASENECKFGISLGDIMFDKLEFYDPLNQSISHIGLPWYNVLGNHDLNFDSPDDDLSTETWQRIYGPRYYSFDYGPVHFVILDDVRYNGQATGGYIGELNYQQLTWLRNDLKHVPKDQLVVFCLHIPLFSLENRQEFFDIIKDHEHTFSLSAHTHLQRHDWFGEKEGFFGSKPHHHLNHATVCGCWWGGAPDERGIPHATMSDGGPNGYSIVEFHRTSYKVTFRAASRPFNEQMSVFMPEEITSAESQNAEVIINVWAGSTKSTVEARINQGNWMSVPNVPGLDPYIQKIKELEASATKPPGRGVAGPSATPHLWKFNLPASLPAGTHRIEVRTRDMWGQEYTDMRTFRVQ
jgi:hypothetical protein